MGEWKTYRLGEIVTIKGGKRLPKGVNLIKIRNSHPYIRIRDIGKTKTIELDSTFEYVDDDTQKTIARYIVQEGDILISIVGTIGLVGIVGKSLDSANLTENCVKLTNLRGVERDFLFYFLKSEYGQNETNKGIVGAVQAKLPIKNIENIKIPLPSLEEQRRIAGILGSLDDKIELNRRINANLEAQAQALFRSWFVDFEPFRDGPFVDSELGKIPQGWKVAELGDVTKQQTEKVGPQKTVKVLSPITTGELVLSEEYFTKQVFSESITKYIIVKPNQFAYNPARINIGSIGRNTFEFDGCVSPVYVVFECEKGYHYFFDFFRKTDAFKQEVISRAIGGVRQTLGYKDFALIKVIYPPQNVVLEFNTIYTNLLNLQNHNNIEVKNLSALRDTLLPKLMAGEIAIK